MKPHVSLVTLGVRDLSRATDFYRALGWETHGEFDGVSFFKLNGMAVALSARRTGERRRSFARRKRFSRVYVGA